MSNKLEKNSVSPETQKGFKNSLINHILELSVDQIVANTKGRDANEHDLAEVMGDMMKEYKTSDMTKKMLGVKNYGDWDSFFDEVADIVFKKVQEAKTKEIPVSSPELKSENLKQKELF